VVGIPCAQGPPRIRPEPRRTEIEHYVQQNQPAAPAVNADPSVVSTQTKNQILLAAAEACLVEGWYIFPLHPGKKEPFACRVDESGRSVKWYNGVNGGYSASNGPQRDYVDPKTGETKKTSSALIAWQDGFDCNVGVALELSGLTALDIDDGINSEDELKDFLADFHIPATRAIRSGRVSSFGVHLLYRGAMAGSAPFVIPWRQKLVRGEVKSRAPRYVAAEGSFHKSGKQYTRLWNLPMIETPVALFDDILTTHPAKTSPNVDIASTADSSGDGVTQDEFEAFAEKNHESFTYAGVHAAKQAHMYLRDSIATDGSDHGGCPWASEHECPNHDGDFAVFIPVNGGPLSAKCQHESCKKSWTTQSCWTSYRAWLAAKNGAIPLQGAGRVFVSKPSAPTSLKPRTYRHPLYTVTTVPSVSGGSQEADTVAPPKRKGLCMSVEDWIKHDFSKEETEPVIGTPGGTIVGPLTKNLVVAGEKAFKTTLLLRLATSLAVGETVIPDLPVLRPHRVLYIHAELNPPEIKQRLIAAVADIDTQGRFYNARDIMVHLIAEEGQQLIREYIEETSPDVIILDPWQELITGFNENSDEHTGIARKFIDSLIDIYKVTVFLVQHAGRDITKGGRGHSGLKGWRDTEIRLTRTESLIRVSVDPRWGRPKFDFYLAFKGGTVHPKTVLFSKQQQDLRDWLKAYPDGATYEQIGVAFKKEDKAVEKMVNRATDTVPPAVIKKTVDGKARVFHPDNVTDNVTTEETHEEEL
jgi:AAA domain/Bifunctional DNA primase/polymerase, N-terminal